MTIGVTGHRPDRLGTVDQGALHKAVGTVLDAIVTATGSGTIVLRLVSALAEGADSIVADAALARNWPLLAVIPFERACYEADFADGPARVAHHARLAHAAAVFELPGNREAGDDAKMAYERAGRVVLAQCDLLVAVWDNGPVRGRGGAAQIVAEAVLGGIPVIQIDPANPSAPELLWDGLEEVDLGQQSLDTVARADLAGLRALLTDLLDPPVDPRERKWLADFGRTLPPRWSASFAYPLLLAVMGIRRPRWSDLRTPAGRAETSLPSAAGTDPGSFARPLREVLAPRFAYADAVATRVAQTFRSGYVANFALAAFAVVLSLFGLALPGAVKPVLVVLEFAAIATILVLTRAGTRANWHRRWLDHRALAERLRCLAVSTQLGDADLRGAGRGTPPWVAWLSRATARELGLPSVRVDAAYLGSVRDDLTALIDAQIAYLSVDARRMHRLEHRLHTLGTWLFALTALTCLALLLFKTTDHWIPALDWLQYPLGTAATIVSAALPAIGAAIYGIRMQGDFAGTAERSDALARQLRDLRRVIAEDALAFDTLARRVRRATDLLTGDLESWLQVYHARPLALPG